jgi:hypothetical protein
VGQESRFHVKEGIGMGDKEHRRRINASIQGEPKTFGSGEGLDASTGSDYKFHKEIVDARLIPLSELSTPKLALLAETILYARKRVANEVYDHRIDYYANRVQKVYFRAAANIMFITKCLSGEDFESLVQMGIMEVVDGSIRFIPDDEYCLKCLMPILDVEPVSTLCSSCEFFSSLKAPKDGIID